MQPSFQVAAVMFMETKIKNYLKNTDLIFLFGYRENKKI